MRHDQHRRLLALLALVAACGVAGVLLAISSGERGASGVLRQGTADGEEPARDRDLVELDARRAAARVVVQDDLPLDAPSEDAEVPVEPEPITGSETFLAGAVRLVDDDGVAAQHREVRLLVRLFPGEGRTGRLLSTATEGGQFDVTFVRRGDGPFALENGSREIGDGPFEGQVAIFGAELASSGARLPLLRETPAGELVAADRLTFDLGARAALIHARAPRSVLLDVVDAETGARVGPVTVGYSRSGRDGRVRPDGSTSPLEFVLPSLTRGALTVRVRGYAPATVEIPGDAREVVRVPMLRSASLEVRIAVDEVGPGGDDRRLVHVALRRVGDPTPADSGRIRASGDPVWRRGGLVPGTYLVTAIVGEGPGVTVGTRGETQPGERGAEASLSLELAPGEERRVVLDLTAGAQRARSPIVLDVAAGVGEVLPVRLQVTLRSTAQASGETPIATLIPPGSERADVPLGAWPAGRYRVVVMGGRATVDFDHAAALGPTRVPVDLGGWLRWQVRLVREGTGDAAPNERIAVALPGSTGARLHVQPDADRVFRFSAPVGTSSCTVLSTAGAQSVRCALPEHTGGVQEVAVPVRDSEPPGSGPPGVGMRLRSGR